MAKPRPNQYRLLLVDDESEPLEMLAQLLREEGYQVETVLSAEDALACFERENFHLLLTDLQLPQKSGIELTKAVHEASPSTCILLLTGYGTIKSAVAALQFGASDYLRKPINPKRLIELIASKLQDIPQYLPNKLLVQKGETNFHGMLARSPAMQRVFEKIQRVAQSDATVLITGENGTGKELAAHAVHLLSSRAQGPYVALHTGAIPRELIASELFGHERGSFTGATERKEGRFELAEGGTLFLDEISTMDERTQINLLRVLETFRYTRVGGKKEKEANVRVVAASNRNLLEMVKAGEFREDLYYRLNILQIELPPLRLRREDISLIANDFLRRFNERYRRNILAITAETMRLLEVYTWPGNVRELRNVIEQAVLLARGDKLEPELLPQLIYRATSVAKAEKPDLFVLQPGMTLRDVEREVILRTLEAQGNNKKLTAEVLGISRRSLYNKLAEYGATAEQDETEET